MVLVFCTLPYGALHLYEISWKYLQTVFILQSGHEFTVEMAVFNVQSAITPKVGKQELQFMCSALCLMVLYICVMFHENIRNVISYGGDTSTR